MFNGLINMFSKKETFAEGKEYEPPVDESPVDEEPVDGKYIEPHEINEEPSKFNSALNKFYNKDNLIMLITFLGIFIVLYIAFGFYFRIFGSGSQDTIVRAANVIGLMALSILVIYEYYHFEDEDLYKSFKDNIEDLDTTIVIIILLGIVIGIKKILRLPTPEGNSSFILDVSNSLLWAALLLNVLIICFTDLLNIPVLTIIEDVINKILHGTDNDDDEIINSSSDKSGSGDKNPQPAEEVFNVSNNLYTYEEAPHVCAALGARLASHDEIKGAYEKGADWCSYGWSQNQMGFFPTQKETWEKLQSNTARKNSCGSPGVNGGYMPNYKMRLGVNCYGVKPQASEKDLERMATSNILPRSRKDIITERKIKFWKENADRMLNLNPHSKSDWSLY